MNSTETAKILGIIAIAYQNFVLDKQKIAVWHEMIGDLDFALAQMAVKKLISESPYPPTIHDIRRCAMEVCHPGLPTPAEAWGILTKNIRNYGSYKAVEGMAALPPLVQETARYIGYTNICRSDEPEGVLRAQFMRMYEQVLNRKKSEHILPLPLRNQIQALAAQLALPKGEKRT